MKANELRSMSRDELLKKDKDLVQELFNLRFQLHTGRLGKQLPAFRSKEGYCAGKRPSSGKKG